MKQIIAYAAALLTLFGVTLWNAAHVADITAGISARLEQAEEAVVHDDWDAAVDIVSRTALEWERQEPYFSVVLRYADTDEVSTGFQEIEGFLRWQERAEFTSANSALIEKVRHLAEVEGLTVGNLF